MPERHLLDNLDRWGRAVGAIARRPRLVVHAAAIAAVLLSWLLLGAVAMGDAAARLDGWPGSGLLRGVPELPLPRLLERLVALCIEPASAASLDATGFIAVSSMWFLMAVAMMLPSAAPLVRTYCEIADTARARGEKAVHPLVLVTGYLAVWLAASLLFAVATSGLQAATGRAPSNPLPGLAGSVALAFAGAYQFSALKSACLKKCRSPFGILFSRWSARPAAIFRLGVEQGAWCLGCCWALMLVMFAVGIMNVFWMAVIALLTLVEKQGHTPLASRAAGAILLVWSAALLVVSTGNS